MSRTILKLDEIAARTRMPIATLRWLRHNGDGPPLWKLGRRVVGYQDEIDAWVEAQRRQGVSGGGKPAA
jgi:predicted DNA-binding transcriptional regulator AlpA